MQYSFGALLPEQWFVRTEPLAKRAIEVVKEGQIRWVPEQWTNTYYQWMENIRIGASQDSFGGDTEFCLDLR